MRGSGPSLRVRLTLWHATVLAGVICVFSAGIFVFVKAQLYRTLDQQIGDDLATIEHVYREETGDLGELGHRIGGTRFQVTEGRTVVYETPGWPPPVDGRPSRTGVLAGASHRIPAARDDASVRRTLRTLALILVMGVPFAVALAIGGGYVLAGRMLAPFGGLAEKARRITAE